MVDTTTTVLGLVKQTIGGNRNTWGTILNTCMDLIEGAIYGMTSKVVTGGSVTLSDAERRARILKFTGTLGSNQAVVVANLIGRWTVYNGTAGSYTLSMKTSSGDAVVIPQGAHCDVWCDGNDVVYAGLSSRLRDTQLLAPDGTLALPGFAFGSELTLGARRAGYASGTLSSNPFTTTNASAAVSVAHTAHGLAVGDYANYAGATAAGGITIDGLYQVTSITSADAYVITHSSVATSTATGGGTPTYKYMKAAATGGGALTLTVSGVDIAHVSPYGTIVTGAFFSSGAAKIGGAIIVGGAGTFSGAGTFTGLLTAAGATLSALLTGTAATLSGLLTLSSTSHFLPPTGTTAQRPGTPVQGSSRFNTTLDQPEFADVGGNWRQPSLAQPISGGYKNLVIANNSGTPNSQIDVDADAVTVETTAGVAYRVSSVNLTINCATTGANGMDTGGLPTSSGVYAFVIYNPTTDTIAGLASLSATAPTMPSGYTAKARLGWRPTNGSAQLHRVLQKGNRAQYIVSASVTTALPTMASGTASSVSTGPTTAVSTTGYVPATAAAIDIKFGFASAGVVTCVAPNALYVGYDSSTNAPFVAFAQAINAVLMLESSNIYWAASDSACRVQCKGWIDNI